MRGYSLREGDHDRDVILEYVPRMFRARARARVMGSKWMQRKSKDRSPTTQQRTFVELFARVMGS
jgi:hypothetical protein